MISGLTKLICDYSSQLKRNKTWRSQRSSFPVPRRCKIFPQSWTKRDESAVCLLQKVVSLSIVIAPLLRQSTIEVCDEIVVARVSALLQAILSQSDDVTCNSSRVTFPNTFRGVVVDC